MTGISFDGKTDAAKACGILKGKTALIGYVDTMSVLLNGTPELVYAASIECIKTGVDCLSAGCALPSKVKNENIAAMVRASHEYKINLKALQQAPNEWGAGAIFREVQI
jgi:uroporphyrinogen-III decarboxylase